MVTHITNLSLFIQGYTYFGLRGYSCYCGSDMSLLGTSTGAGEAACNYQTTTFSVYEIPTGTSFLFDHFYVNNYTQSNSLIEQLR